MHINEEKTTPLHVSRSINGFKYAIFSYGLQLKVKLYCDDKYVTGLYEICPNHFNANRFGKRLLEEFNSKAKHVSRFKALVALGFDPGKAYQAVRCGKPFYAYAHDAI